MQVLLATWKEKMPVDQALELLDFNFPDKNVRKYAVDCLQELRYDMWCKKELYSIASDKASFPTKRYRTQLFKASLA